MLHSKFFGLALVAISAAMAFGHSAQAETLLIQRVQSDGAVLPKRGSSKSMVVAKFGQPNEKHAPVAGYSKRHPPITRWDYADFSVYFEYDHVVDAVLRRASSTEEGPKSIR